MQLYPAALPVAFEGLLHEAQPGKAVFGGGKVRRNSLAFFLCSDSFANAGVHVGEGRNKRLGMARGTRSWRRAVSAR